MSRANGLDYADARESRLARGILSWYDLARGPMKGDPRPGTLAATDLAHGRSWLKGGDPHPTDHPPLILGRRAEATVVTEVANAKCTVTARARRARGVTR